MEHTKGPWRVYAQTTVLSDVGVIADTSCCDFLNPEPVGAPQNEANARLIAAAPEMLETLEYLEAVLSEQSEETFERELIRIRAAIAKAEGK